MSRLYLYGNLVPIVLALGFCCHIFGFQHSGPARTALPAAFSVVDQALTRTPPPKSRPTVRLKPKASSTPEPTPPPTFPPMAFPGVNWQQESPETLGIDSARLEEAFSHLSQHLDTSATAVVRYGYLIRTGTAAHSRFETFSVTKSFTSTVLALLIDDGRASLNTLASDYGLTMAANYPRVKMWHFATMTSGYDAVGESYEPPDGASNPFLLDTPLFRPPGTQRTYMDDARISSAMC